MHNDERDTLYFDCVLCCWEAHVPSSFDVFVARQSVVTIIVITCCDRRGGVRVFYERFLVLNFLKSFFLGLRLRTARCRIMRMYLSTYCFGTGFCIVSHIRLHMYRGWYVQICVRMFCLSVIQSFLFLFVCMSVSSVYENE